MASRKKALAGRKNARLGALTNLPGHSVDDQDRATRVQGQSSQSRASSHVGKCYPNIFTYNRTLTASRPSASSSGQEQNRTRERAAPSLLGGQQQQLQPMQSQPSQLQPCPTATPAKRAMFNVGSHSPSNTDLSTSSQPRSKSTAPVADLKLAQQPFAKMRSQGGILPVAPLAPAPPPVVPVAPHPPSHPPVNGLPHASANLSAAEAVIHAPRTKKVVLADDEDDDDWDETDTDLDSELEEDPKSFIDAEKGGTLVEKSLAGEGGEDEDWVSEDDKDDSDRSRRAPAPPVVSSTAKKSPRSGVKPTSHRPGPSRHHSQPNIATITSLAKQKSQPQSQLLKQEARQTHAAPHQRTQVAVGGHHRVSRRPEREAQQQQQRQQAAMEQKLRDAALEAQRQRDMFTKVPPRSYSNLGTRSQSGLLSQLMNPDPEIFPDNHPYKRGYSSGDVAVGGRASNGLTRLGIQRLTALTTAAAGNAQMRSNLTSAAPNAALNASRVLPPPRPVQLTELEAGPSTIRRPVNVVGPTTSNAAPSTARKAPNGENVTLEVKPSTTTTTTTTSATSQRSSSVLEAGPSTARISLVNGGSTTGVGRAYSKAPPLRPTKSSAALPVANSVTASSYGGDLSALADRVKGKKREVLSNGSSGGAYRPKGRPLEVEMEDTSGDDTDQGLHISKSVAQEKLAAFADRRISKASSSTTRTLNSAAAAPARPPAPAPAPPVQQPHPDPVPPPQPLRSVSQYVGNAHETIGTPPVQVPLSLAFPYNLPPAAPPSSPRTTRQLMLRTEISESLRQNLLWSRKIHKKEFNGPRRSSSSTLSSALQPLTTFPTVVHLSEKKNKESESAGAGGAVVMVIR
ncbi:hypothetical protein D9757_015249 [Collybiopsis confluens]|uniref:DUF3295 domain-containing protein n=1 Tax=Collybiopsis confluens TaxID=2823264 RepID=A0A8H5CPE8_9AGAR|nr:hypothetical protein D9757_015249 [Collybiopsis confluens]